ncbi:MAG: hypothetical protein KatS3mg050_0364 [Litorilinea sp.]|nr:MAG: hypothetical protein KatS3mg050_0364 [Litorilinea sp.]
MAFVAVLLLGLLAGWAANWAIETLPPAREGHPAGQASWAWPFHRLADLVAGQGQAPSSKAAGLRTLAVWGGAFLLVTLAYWRLGWSLQMVMVALVACFFLAIAVIDLEHRLVLNRMLLPALPFLLLAGLVIQWPRAASPLLGAAVGFGLFLAIALVRPGGMGMGDVKLAGAIGLVTGLSGIWIAVVVCIFTGGLAALALLVYCRLRGQSVRGQTMAYAPYLVLGAWAALYFGPELWRLYLGLPLQG